MKNSTLVFLIFLITGFHSSFAQYVIHIAGNDSCGYSGDGGPAINASTSGIGGICGDRDGNLYFSEKNRIRKINAATGVVHTIAGGTSMITATDAAAHTSNSTQSNGLVIH